MYYFSPLGIYCFGIADISQKEEELIAYIFHEGKAMKGGNTVMSLLLQFLSNRGWIQPGFGPWLELNLIVDNCTGQNKNRMVLCLAILLVELGYYKRVNIIFLVTRHMKNACDRLFNALKVDQQSKNLFTMEQMLESLNASKHCTAVCILPEWIRDFDAFEDNIYRRIQSGSVKKNHHFYSDSMTPGVLHVHKTSAAAYPIKVQLLAKTSNHRKALLDGFNHTTLSSVKQASPPSLKKIKRVELFKKWCKYIPEHLRSPLYNNLGEDLLREIANQRNVKAAARKKAKQSDEAAEAPEEADFAMV